MILRFETRSLNMRPAHTNLLSVGSADALLQEEIPEYTSGQGLEILRAHTMTVTEVGSANNG